MGFFNIGALFGSNTTNERGCELAPKEAPAGLKLATFAGKTWLMQHAKKALDWLERSNSVLREAVVWGFS